MAKTTYRPDRLLKLAEHLESGKLGHERFDFSVVDEMKPGESRKANGCGTLGHTIGEMPIVWPDDFSFDGYGWIRGEGRRPFDDGSDEWFGISRRHSNWLFLPNCSGPQLPALDRYATAAQVASNIRLYVKLREEGAIRDE